MKIKILIEFEENEMDEAKKAMEMLEEIQESSMPGVSSVELEKIGIHREGMVYPDTPGVCTRFRDHITKEEFEIWEWEDENGKFWTVKGKDRSGQWRAKDITLTASGWEVSTMGRRSGKRSKLSPDECMRIANALGATYDGKLLKGNTQISPKKAVEIWRYFIR